MVEANLRSLVELAERRRLETALQQSLDQTARHVVERTSELQDANTALRVLLGNVEKSNEARNEQMRRANPTGPGAPTGGKCGYSGGQRALTVALTIGVWFGRLQNTALLRRTATRVQSSDAPAPLSVTATPRYRASRDLGSTRRGTNPSRAVIVSRYAQLRLE